MRPEPSSSVAPAGGLLALGCLFAALYGAYGTESPFFPSFLAARGLSPASVGAVLAAGTVVRLAVGPIAGVAADRFGIAKLLAMALLGSGAIILLYLVGRGVWPLLVVCLLHSVTTSPLTAFADAIALRASERHWNSEGSFPYGWVRGIGSAGFIAGTLVSGLLVQRFGLDAIIVVAGGLFAFAAVPLTALPRLPIRDPDATSMPAASRGVVELLAIPAFRAILAYSTLVIGSHAMLDGFAVIHWRSAGIGDGVVGLLWSVAVVSEVVVFVFIGPPLLARYGAARCATAGAVAGVLRWATLALTTDIAALASSQLLHGLTFSLVHLACMQGIARRVPDALAATAQTIYGTLCIGLASMVLTALSGLLYQTYGAAAFWPMAAVCLLAVPLASRLTDAEGLATDGMVSSSRPDRV